MKLPALLVGLMLAPLLARAETPSPEPMFAASLVDQSSQPASMAPFRGRPLVVNFWARWCGPCRTEIPDLISEHRRLHGTDLQIVGIALDDKPDAVRDFAKAYDIDYPVLVVRENGIELLRALGNPKAGLPYTLVLDRRGQVVFTKLGPMSKSEMAAATAAALR